MNTNPTRSSRCPRGKSLRRDIRVEIGKLPGGVHRGKSPASMLYISTHPSLYELMVSNAFCVCPMISCVRSSHDLCACVHTHNLERTVAPPQETYSGRFQSNHSEKDRF